MYFIPLELSHQDESNGEPSHQDESNGEPSHQDESNGGKIVSLGSILAEFVALRRIEWYDWISMYFIPLEPSHQDESNGGNAENEIVVEEEEQLIEDDEEDEFWFDWMFLAEMGLNPSFDCSSDLGSRDMDRNHDWINDPRQRYNDTDLRDIDTFISSNSRISTEEENLTVDYQTLNDNQKKVFNRIEAHYHDVLVGHQVKPLRIIVMGTAGTGKTYLIEAI
ncbi:ATP-dependent DNA helicase PIF1 [Rhizophagus irregularis DAOM 181602=DAOM 197198]|nr:ATP-dependent DNA helicase PIF1 [Rhizophagus irregularis DAOM 181602=DAOM 197198]